MNQLLSSCGNLYTLSFTFQFPPGEDKVFYFAHSVPYTYSMLAEFLDKKAKRKFVLC